MQCDGASCAAKLGTSWSFAAQKTNSYFTSSDLDMLKQPRWHHPPCVSVRWRLLANFISASSPPPRSCLQRCLRQATSYRNLSVWHSLHISCHSDTLFGISSHILSGSFWHLFWHSFWQSFWHIFWHSFWRIFWQSFCWLEHWAQGIAVEVRRGTLWRGARRRKRRRKTRWTHIKSNNPHLPDRWGKMVKRVVQALVLFVTLFRFNSCLLKVRQTKISIDEGCEVCFIPSAPSL